MDQYRLRSEIMAAIGAEIESQSKNVAAGKCADMSEYSKVCGSISGMYRAQEIIRVAFTKLLLEEDE